MGVDLQHKKTTPSLYVTSLAFSVFLTILILSIGPCSLALNNNEVSSFSQKSKRLGSAPNLSITLVQKLTQLSSVYFVGSGITVLLMFPNDDKYLEKSGFVNAVTDDGSCLPLIRFWNKCAHFFHNSL